MSFLRNFTDWAGGTEVPEQYTFWSGLASLAALVNGRVFIRMGYHKIYPNLYIVLLGSPGNGKTSALRMGERIVRAFPELPVSAQAETPEGLLRYMRDKCKMEKKGDDGKMVEYTPISCFMPELSNFFGKDPAGMIDFLTGVWDCNGDNFHRRTKGQGEDMIPSPFVNLLACTTQDWITNYLKVDIIGGGFTRRVVFVNEMMTDDSIRVPWPDKTPSQLQAKENCIAYGRVLTKVEGEMSYGPGARAWWDTWYTTRKISREPDVRGYDKSKPVNLLKVATLVALSRAPERTVLIEDFEVALALLEKTEAYLKKVFQSIGRNELNSIANQLVDILVNTAPTKLPVKGSDGTFIEKEVRAVPEKIIRGLMYRHAPGKELDDIINHLIASERVTKIVDTRNPAKVMIVLLENVGKV